MKKYLVFIILVFLGMILYCFFYKENKINEVDKELPKEVREDIKRIKSLENEENIAILNMKEDYYFLKKYAGYEYSVPKDFKYYSKVLKKDRIAKVLLPKGYNKNEEYPLLIVLHGYGGSKNTWLNKKIDIMINNVTTFENVPKMITVFVDSNLNEDEDLKNYDFIDAVKYFDKTEKEVIDSVLPEIERNFKIKKGRENKAIAGQSLGGRNAIATAFHNHNKFAYVGAFGPSKVIKDDNQYFDGFFRDFNEVKAYNFKDIFICVGDKDNLVGYEVNRLINKMSEDNVEKTFVIFHGKHDDGVWQLGMYNFLKRIFRK